MIHAFDRAAVREQFALHKLVASVKLKRASTACAA